jgi:hypothetical protein
MVGRAMPMVRHIESLPQMLILLEKEAVLGEKHMMMKPLLQVYEHRFRCHLNLGKLKMRSTLMMR